MRLAAETGHVSEAVADALADGELALDTLDLVGLEQAHAAEVIASAQRSLRRST